MKVSLGDTRLPRRFWSKVSVEAAGCWLWTAGVDRGGYGKFRATDGRSRLAHVVAYEALVAAVPDGLDLDHVKARGCTGPACCFPDHLEPVTRAENIRRAETGKARGAQQRAKTHCPQGHEYTPSNTRIWRCARKCRICGRHATARWSRTARSIGGR